ncbi:ABC transporter substrate-binding protein [Psychroflexus sediminis]|uniref:Peptide/nickel transport system substrate-binding protein n=1 Tax=Psychroflexus sediminis TaxID=470826 RepID=A0A1G7YMW3_9FLAO|nr:ABC transporter substrate-binding protein [Psychroflexus sediminis]SDG97724.1 peptide/nickel transport system substrate-binding protein [Psychroflexus sediminis]
MNTHSILSFLLLLNLLVLTSCSDSKISDRDHLVFRYNEHANITSLDPAFAKDQRNIWPAHQLYNSLVKLDKKLSIEGDIARSWTISEDGLTYEFELRDDVFFHKHPIFGKDSTRQVLASDVEYSLKRLTDPKVASPGSWVMSDVKRVKALSDSVIQIELLQKFPAFLGLLSSKFCSVLPVEMDKLDFQTSPLGTGPFKFKRWETGEKLVLRKNNLYFKTDADGNALPYLEAVAISFLPDKQSEFLAFVQGKLDFLSGLDPSYKDELITVDGELNSKFETDIAMEKSPYLNTEYLGFYLDSDTEEMKSKAFRRAINYAFDRDKMIKYLRNNIGIPAHKGFIPEGLSGRARIQGFTYEPEKARKLIQEFKEETGIQEPKLIISTNPSYIDLVEFIQKEVQRIGVEVEIDVMPPSTIRQKRSAGQLETFRASWIADYPDAINYLSLFYSENFSPNGPNYTHFKNETYDRLYEKAISITRDSLRYNLYSKMDSLLIEEAPVIPLYYDEVVRFRSKAVKGLGINPFNLLDLSEVKKTR